MNSASTLGVYALGLAAVFGGAVGVGNVLGPTGATAQTEKGHGGQGGHGGHDRHGGGHSTEPGGTPGGLQVSQDGYTLVPETTVVRPGLATDFRFTVNGPDGRPVTRYEPLHGKKLHLIVANRDLSGFQHLHPTQAGGGVWTVPLTLPEAGTYRFFTDIKPTGRSEQLTLGTDVTAPGNLEPAPLPEPVRVAQVDGYEVRLDGTLVPGRSSKLTLTVSKSGEPVTDLEPYLEAYGHLVALRAGDLAYLHVHPDGAPEDGRTRPGPAITFHAEAPSSGTYRLYLDFQHGGTVRTAEFTATAGDVPAPNEPEPAGHGDHGH